jgi:hypothetical protein
LIVSKKEEKICKKNTEVYPEEKERNIVGER